MLTNIKLKLAEEIVAAFQQIYPDIALTSQEVVTNIELPKNFSMGQLAYPVFSFSKILKKAPPVIAKELAEALKNQKLTPKRDVQFVAGYVNVFFDDLYLSQVLISGHSANVGRLGFSQAGNSQTIVIDYSSPNVAKPMSIGHLRATVIGQAIRNLAESQGFKVIGINHLGDWGTQFGKLAWAMDNWGAEYDFEQQPMDSLFKIYVRFHDEAEKNPQLEVEGAKYFKRLEDGDSQITALWQKIRDISLKDYQRLYDLLGVKFDLIQGEAFYNDKLAPTVERIRKAGILKESEGAQVVFLEDNQPPCLILKSDGASIYATRDIASAIYRREVLKGDAILYVVGAEQSLHFQQVFGVLKKMGYEWANNCQHIAFGLYRFKDIGKMSTRKGNVIYMEDILKRAIEGVREIIEQKNPQLEHKEKVAKQVGIGAVIFNDLVNDRVKNIDFDWGKVLDFEGDSGPYIQYCAVRGKSLMRKYAKSVDDQVTHHLSTEEERELILWLLNYADVLEQANRLRRPNVLAQYLLDVCRAFNHFYHKTKILDSSINPELVKSRMALVKMTTRTLEEGLGLLGIQTPEAM